MIALPKPPRSPRSRLKLFFRGAVQGVGFRPFIYRMAAERGLAGWVNNSPQGVFLEIEGATTQLVNFVSQLELEKPPRSDIQGVEAAWLEPANYECFEIRKSAEAGEKSAMVLPDIATCPECLREIFDPHDRRYRYPFTNCTHCGPRFTIVEALPYDRANTSMKEFSMCARCQAEYDDPLNRRFHAQPNACPDCGPHLELWENDACTHAGDDALLRSAEAIRRGRIVAVKAIGGCHLMVDARNEAALRLLRRRKHREEKPFALMLPSIADVQALCTVSGLEEQLLLSPEAPIVLLPRKRGAMPVANAVAPGNPNLAIMLPSNPLHHLLMTGLNFPVVATSGNLSDEPICTDEFEAKERLRGIADLFLVHNRRIVRHVDDSIVRVILDRPMVLRRSRGYAPSPVMLNKKKQQETRPILALGAHLKNSIALSTGEQVFLSQHIGDLETEGAHNAFRRVVQDFQRLYDPVSPIVARDLHPDYLSSRFAQELGGDVVEVQHHIAHVLSCMAEHGLTPPLLGIAWDGTGYGLDGTIWGGEFFLVTETMEKRIAHLRPFRLPGGDAAIKEPRRAALGLLYEARRKAVWKDNQAAPFSRSERALLETMLERGINSPLTTSIGRLFDAVASITGVRHKVAFEGQAAMDLEFAMEGSHCTESYRFDVVESSLGALVLDWGPMLESILADNVLPIALISARFHNALVEAIVEITKRVGLSQVVLSGGCFQNRYLTERTVTRLRAEGFEPHWHQRVPPNDGGIALGQAVAATRID
jgi:hydrogenase maturation protein HypF